MKISEARRLLQVISSVDGRPVNEEAAGVWAGLLDDVELPDALDATKDFFRNHPDRRIAPGHVRERALGYARERWRREQEARPKVTPWGYSPGDPRNDDARRAWEAARENASAPPLPPVRVVESPALRWEHERRHSAALERAASRLLTDPDRIAEVERARERYLEILGQMMERPTDDVQGPEETYPGAVEDPRGGTGRNAEGETG